METLWQDIRYGVRMLAKARGFTAVAVIALALGIGVNTAVFSVADGLLWKPLPVPESDRLVMVLATRPQWADGWTGASPADYFDWREQARSFTEWAAFHYEELNLTGTGDPEQLQGARATPEFFTTTRAQPLLGRMFTPQDAAEGNYDVIVLGQGLWERRFGADRSLIGRTVKLNGKDLTVIGVLPKSFRFPTAAAFWVPLEFTPEMRSWRARRYLRAVARLADSISVRQAHTEISGIASRLSDAYPDTNRDWQARVMPLPEFMNGNLTRSYTYLLLGSVGFVLLIACFNVANLQFARAAARQKEAAVRTALGASRVRLVRQMLTESVLVGLMGAALGVLLAAWCLNMILVNMPPDVERWIGGWDRIGLDPRALWFTIGIAVLSGIVAGVLPAFQTSRVDVNEALKEGGRGTSAGRMRHRLRSVLVVGEVTLSLVLLVGAGLMVKGFTALLDRNAPFEPDRLLTGTVLLPDAKYSTDPLRAAFWDQALERLRTTPGVTQVALLSGLPSAENVGSAYFSIENRPVESPEEQERQLAVLQNISPEYFRVMRIRLMEGREFRANDTLQAEPVAIISHDFAEKFFPGQSSLGRRIRVGDAKSTAPWLTILGVVDDVRHNPWNKGAEYALYRPYPQAGRTFQTFVLRAQGDPLAQVPAVRRAIAAVDPQQPIAAVKMYDQVIHETVVGVAYVAVMLSVLGVIALVLASVGLYAVMANAVAERTHEIGIRMALGAQRRDVFRLVVGRGLLLTVTGIVLGLAGAYALAQTLSGLLFGVSSSDPLAFGGIPLLLALVALAACWIPARRATRVDPMAALRQL